MSHSQTHAGLFGVPNWAAAVTGAILGARHAGVLTLHSLRAQVPQCATHFMGNPFGFQIVLH